MALIAVWHYKIHDAGWKGGTSKRVIKSPVFSCSGLFEMGVSIKFKDRWMNRSWSNLLYIMKTDLFIPTYACLPLDVCVSLLALVYTCWRLFTPTYASLPPAAHLLLLTFVRPYWLLLALVCLLLLQWQLFTAIDVCLLLLTPFYPYGTRLSLQKLIIKFEWSDQIWSDSETDHCRKNRTFSFTRFFGTRATFSASVIYKNNLTEYNTRNSYSFSLPY